MTTFADQRQEHDDEPVPEWAHRLAELFHAEATVVLLGAWLAGPELDFDYERLRRTASPLTYLAKR